MWVKICGWRTARMLESALETGVRPDAVGLNFYSGSPRGTDLEIARGIVQSLPPEIEPVGLFVDHTVREIDRVSRLCGLRTLQLHGDYAARDLAPLQDFRLIRVYRLGGHSLDPVRRDLDECRAAGVTPWACLAEAKVDGAYGGTGVVGPWGLLRQWPADLPPLILAGGLTTQNVAEAIDTVRPWGVDTASGVETQRGVKDPDLVAAFIQTARARGAAQSR